MAKKGANAKPKAQPKEPVAAGAAEAASGDHQVCEVDTNNVDHYNEVEQAIQVILGHPVFENIMTEEPLGIKEGVASHLAGHKAGPNHQPSGMASLLVESLLAVKIL